LPAARRGLVHLERFVVSTAHPLGLFRAWAVVHPPHSAIAWPAPSTRDLDPPLTSTDTGAAQAGTVGDEDFAGLRPFQTGDSLRRVAWKAYARGQGLHTKQYAGTDVVSHVFDWDSLGGLGTEDRLAQLCRWVLDAHERGEAFGLRLPGTTIEVNVGTAHRERCLNALALFASPEIGATRGSAGSSVRSRWRSCRTRVSCRPGCRCCCSRSRRGAGPRRNAAGRWRRAGCASRSSSRRRWACSARTAR
jgi:uncharacterized protein (DUF58 family)